MSQSDEWRPEPVGSWSAAMLSERLSRCGIHIPAARILGWDPNEYAAVDCWAVVARAALAEGRDPPELFAFLLREAACAENH